MICRTVFSACCTKFLVYKSWLSARGLCLGPLTKDKRSSRSLLNSKASKASCQSYDDPGQLQLSSPLSSSQLQKNQTTPSTTTAARNQRGSIDCNHLKTSEFPGAAGNTSDDSPTLAGSKVLKTSDSSSILLLDSCTEVAA